MGSLLDVCPLPLSVSFHQAVEAVILKLSLRSSSSMTTASPSPPANHATIRGCIFRAVLRGELTRERDVGVLAATFNDILLGISSQARGFRAGLRRRAARQGGPLGS